MKILQAVSAALAATLIAAAGHASPLPVAKRTLTAKDKYAEINVEYPSTGMKAIDDDLLASVNAYADQFRAEAKGAYRPQDGADTLDMTFTIVRNDAAMFVVMFDVDTDMHGAHPNQDIWTANYFRPDGWRVYLPELFDSPRALPKISALAIADLTKRIASGADAMTDKDWIGRGAGPFGPNFAAFALMPDRIHIWYPPYQVAAYAAGPQEGEVPLAPLKPFLRTNPRAPAASFDCSKPATPVEAVTCADVGLARLDRKIAEAYANALIDSTDDAEKAKKRDAQRAWLARRNQLCKPGPTLTTCLSGIYKARVAALQPG